MNIFILDQDISKNVKYYCDKHIVKMPLELAQMISTTYYYMSHKNLPEYIFSKPSYINHPCTKWIRESKENFIYGCKLGLSLYNEYQYRYNKPDKMQRVKNIFEYGIKHPPRLISKGLTSFVMAMPEIYKTELYHYNGNLESIRKNAISAYRNYYIYEKRYFAKWTKRPIPKWFIEGLNNV